MSIVAKSRSVKSIRKDKSAEANVDGEYKKGIILPDTHAPYHNKTSWELVTHVVKEWGPEIVDDLGDHFDIYADSQHRKDTSRQENIREEIERAREMLHIFCVCQYNYFVEGNHEC